MKTTSLFRISVLLGITLLAFAWISSSANAVDREYQSVFKNPQAEAAYMAAYDRALEKWQVPYETQYVPTAYGDTHMIISGPEDGEPLILIHGMGSNATDWSLIIVALAQSYQVYALDIMGHVGKSKPLKALANRVEFAEWVTSILDALGIEKTYMAGYSLGGFLTTCYALEKPERLKKIVLLAPAATFLPFSEEWHLKETFPGVIGGLAIAVYDVRRATSYALGGMYKMYNISKEELVEANMDLAELMPTFEEESLKEYRKRIDSLLKKSIKDMHAPGTFREDTYPELFWTILSGIEYGKPLIAFGPYALPDEELKKLKTPTLLLIGDHEILYDAEQALKRAGELVENIRTALVPNAGHMMKWEQPELVSSHILNFLSGDK